MGPHGLLISQNMGKIPDFYKSMNIKMRLVIIKNRYFLLFCWKGDVYGERKVHLISGFNGDVVISLDVIVGLNWCN